MSIDLRLPDIKGNEREQLKQIRSYLYQLIPQLQFAFDQLSLLQSDTPAVNSEKVFDKTESDEFRIKIQKLTKRVEALEKIVLAEATDETNTQNEEE